MSFTIIQDSREKRGWSFEMVQGCEGIVVQKLDEGDYTTQELLALEVEGEPGILRIERKASSAEICLNFGQGYDRFFREMERLQSYEYKYIILEFSQETLLKFPEGSGIPKYRWYKKSKKTGKKIKAIKMSGKYMMSLLQKIELEYGIPVIFAGDKDGAEEEAIQIIKEIHELKGI